MALCHKWCLYFTKDKIFSCWSKAIYQVPQKAIKFHISFPMGVIHTQHVFMYAWDKWVKIISRPINVMNVNVLSAWIRGHFDSAAYALTSYQSVFTASQLSVGQLCSDWNNYFISLQKEPRQIIALNTNQTKPKPKCQVFMFWVLVMFYRNK